MISFDFYPPTRIVFGPGNVETLGELAGELGARRALVVSDPGLVAAGHTDGGMAALRRAGIEAHLFDFDGDLYGAWVRIEWVERIRDIRRFDSLEALRSQLSEDARAARRILGL
jgi:hypothetical protein